MTPPPRPPVKSIWPDLEQKDDIFEYLALVYEKRNSDRYVKLIDDHYFVFFFSKTDFDKGIVPQASWGRVKEIGAVQNMFSGRPNYIYGAVTSINLTLTPEGPWIEVPKTEPPFAGETWYQKTAEYRIHVQTDKSYSLIGEHIKMLFVVRFTEADGDSIWRIVEMHDDVEN